jgi:hypothetical protein
MAQRVLTNDADSQQEQLSTRSGRDEGRRPGGADTEERPTADQSTPSRIVRISTRAFELYEERGGRNGRALEDWLQAEREIDGADEGR